MERGRGRQEPACLLAQKAQQEDISPTKEIVHPLGRKISMLWLIKVRNQSCSLRNIGIQYCGYIQVMAHACGMGAVGRTHVKFMELYSWRVAMVQLSLTSMSIYSSMILFLSDTFPIFLKAMNCLIPL